MKSRSKLRIIFVAIAAVAVLAVSAITSNYYRSNTENFRDTHTYISLSDASPLSTSDTISKTELPVLIPPDSFTVQMGGDVLLHDSVVNASKTGTSAYGHIPNYLSLFKDVFVSDLNIINLEGPTDTNGSNKDVKGFPVFNMPYEILTALKDINVDVCVTANNHTCDMGFKGVEGTVKNVIKAGMDPVGSYAAKEDSEKCYIAEINNIKVGIAAFTSYTEGTVKAEKSFCVNKCGKTESSMLDSVKPAIDKLKANGAQFIIVALHWGNEYKDAPSDVQKSVAKQLCDYGADVIMGSHSHCVQPIEILSVDRGGVQSKALVIYSLGNLFTNQTGLKKTKTQEGMVVSVKAVRDDDGYVRIHDAFYMPTYTYVQGGKGENFMKLMAVGEYAFTDTKPSFFKNDSAWKKCKNAWDNVTGTVGSAIPAIKCPTEYPADFFSIQEQ